MKHKFYKKIALNRILSLLVGLLITTGTFFAVGLEPVLASETIYLGDGGWSVPVGTWDPVSRIAVLTQDTSSSIVITSNYIVLDGNGYTISGDGTGNGVYTESKHDITIRNLLIVGKQNGVKLYKTHHSIVENNTISNNTQLGIYLYEATLVSVINNKTFSNGLAGISVRAYSTYNTIENNESYLNETGIKFEGGFNNIVRNNEIRDNTAYGLLITNDLALVGGVLVTLVTDDNQIYNNNFVNNWAQAYVYTSLVGDNNVFNLDLPIGGNYWSNWTSPDENNDGIVDSPYVHVPYGVQDNLPWTTPNGWLNLPLPNQAPIADAGGPYSTILGNAVTFDGGSSYDPDATSGDSIVSYNWDIVETYYVLAGVTPTLSIEEINALGIGTYSVNLTVTDSFGATHTDTTTLEILPLPTTVLEDAETLATYFVEAVADELLTGIGQGNSAGGRLRALDNMLEAVCKLIKDEQYEKAQELLQDIYNKIDGQQQPPDFAIGDAIDEIVAMILELMERLPD